MTEASPIDPRYDARFQRGYAGGSALPAGEAPHPRGGSAAEATGQSTPAEPVTSDRERHVGDGPVASPTATPVVADPDPATPAGPGSAEASDRPHTDAPTEPAVAATTRAIATRWLWIVLGLGIVSVLAGVWAAWTVATSPGRYDGASLGDVDTQMVLSALSGPLVEIGVLGIVAALLGWALFAGRHPQPAESRVTEPRATEPRATEPR